MNKILLIISSAVILFAILGIFLYKNFRINKNIPRELSFAPYGELVIDESNIEKLDKGLFVTFERDNTVKFIVYKNNIATSKVPLTEDVTLVSSEGKTLTEADFQKEDMVVLRYADLETGQLIGETVINYSR